MPRDEGLEAQMRDLLREVGPLAERAMFGGQAWFLHGHLLCCARDDGALFRLGKGRDAWALAEDGIGPMRSGGRVMSGWVRATPEAMADDALAERLRDAALAFVDTLPATR